MSVTTGRHVSNCPRRVLSGFSSRQLARFAPPALLWMMALATPAPAEDWPQWGRTAARNMAAPARGLPDHFTPGRFKPGTDDREIDPATTQNVKWVARLGSQSYGNAVVAQGRVLVGTNNDPPRDPQHQGDRSILLCLDEKDGELLWQLVVPKRKEGRAVDWDQLGILSSPAVQGNRVYLVSSRCEVLCLDLNGQADGNDGPFKDEAGYVVRDTDKPPAVIGGKDADILWVFDMMDELGVFPHNAANCSPLLIGDLVFVSTSNGRDWTHMSVPAPFSPSCIALNKTTGVLAGEDDAGIGGRLLHGQWSSPASGVVNGRALVFFGAGDGWLYAFDAVPDAREDRHALKTVWKYDCNPPEYWIRDGKPTQYGDPEGPSEINATPVFYRNRVYVATGQDPEYGDGLGHLVCVDATKAGDVTGTATVWSWRGIRRSLSTVSIDPETGLLFAGDFAGFVHCLDAETGKVRWTHDVKAHIWGSTLVADGKVYVGDEDGDFTVLAAAPEKSVISETSLGEPMCSTPITANGVLYLQTHEHLYALHDASLSGR